MTEPDAWVDLPPPPGWKTKLRGERWTAESPSGLTALEWSRLRLAPTSERAAIVDALRAAAPRGCGVIIDRHVQGETRDGWPVVLVDARFQRGDGSAAGAAHGAFYRFFAFHGQALAVSVDAAQLAASLEEIHGAMLAARPDVSRLFLGPCDFFGATPATGP